MNRLQIVKRNPPANAPGKLSSVVSMRCQWSSLRHHVCLGALVVLLVCSQLPTLASASTKDTAPSAPRHVTAAATSRSVIVRFQPPSSDGGHRISYYRIHVYPTTQVVVCRSTTCSIPGLVQRDEYSFAVDAVNKIGAGEFSVSTKKVTAIASTATIINVVFSENGGSGTMANETEADGTTAALNANTFTNTGKSFIGWNAAANGKGTSFTNGATLTFTSNLTLYAQWIDEKSASTIAFDANGGSGTMVDEVEVDGTAATLATSTFTYAGHSFGGWNTEANGSGTSYANGGTVDLTSSVTLYAQWTAFTYAGTQSTDWSGYVVPITSTKLEAVSAEWKVPILDCGDTPNSDVAVWVGTGGATLTDGSSSGSLLKTGIEDNCANGVQHNSGFFGLSPNKPNDLKTYSDFPVTAGDEIIAQVNLSSAGFWDTVLKDLTTGLEGTFIVNNFWQVSTISTLTPVSALQYATSAPYSGARSAEWIVEDPANAGGSGLSTFANFGTVTFTDLGVGTASGSWSLLNSDAIEQTGSNNFDEARTGQLVGSGTPANFTVAYVHLGQGEPA